MLLVGLFTASLGAAFFHFLEPNMVFNFWAKWISKLPTFLGMPLGLCPYCNTTWIAIVVYLYVFGLNLFIFLFIGIVYLFLKLILLIPSR
jgi:hypothetical protein